MSWRGNPIIVVLMAFVAVASSAALDPSRQGSLGKVIGEALGLPWTALSGARSLSSTLEQYFDSQVPPTFPQRRDTRPSAQPAERENTGRINGRLPTRPSQDSISTEDIVAAPSPTQPTVEETPPILQSRPRDERAQARPPSPTPKPKPVPKKPSFSFGRKVQLAYGPALVWDGCSNNTLVTGGKGTNRGCHEDYMHPKFASHMEKHFFRCSLRAAEAAGLPTPARIHINHAGCYANRNTSGGIVSLHAHARAIDIYDWNLIDASGKTTRISANISNFRGATRTFYNKFRECWKYSLPDRCRSGYKREGSGSIGHTRSAMGGNGEHADHLHITFPPCGG